ncbi:uncharacterized protein METZ01_LOCUS132574 [marine metagenome]|uniref:Uncharacterized protein n=1 Tax=marine metagenome TaxID=408172 RepID=A0A381YRX4_9ZZZZ
MIAPTVRDGYLNATVFFDDRKRLNWRDRWHGDDCAGTDVELGPMPWAHDGVSLEGTVSERTIIV